MTNVTANMTSAVKSIIILAYQRSGSTFLGSLFNADPRVFYVFEPLDALYSHLFGTSPGWNVPSDIVTSSNGSIRYQYSIDLNESSINYTVGYKLMNFV